MPEFGIELVDIQFQRVNYEALRLKVFERMIQDRKSIANAYRSKVVNRLAFAVIKNAN